MRSLDAILPAEQVIADEEIVLWRALPRPERVSVGPFVFLDHYRSTSSRGIGDKPHPHAGIAVLSYLLDGGMEHRDSLGNVDRLGPGDAQFMQAGRGLLHAERPFGPRHGLQMWTNLPSHLKLSAPVYCSFRAGQIPELLTPGMRTRVVAGRVGNVTGPAVLPTATVFAHVRLEAGADGRLIAEADELAVYVLDGAVAIGDRTMRPGGLGLLGAGSELELASPEGADLAMIGGAAVEGPVLFAGPFVMDTPERLMQARQDFLSGRMGRLDGVP